MPNRPQTTTDPAKALGRTISQQDRRIRALELRPAPEAGGSSGGTSPVTPPYAIQVKRWTGGSVPVSSASETLLHFQGRYFEQNNGAAFPADGHVWPPAAGSSMWTDASDALLTAPVSGLWGFRVAYAYDSMPLGSFVRTRVDHNGSTVAITEHAREAAPAGSTALWCELEGTAYMEAGDWIKAWTRQESGSSQSIYIDPGAVKDDVPGTGPIFAMWLIAEESATTVGGSGGGSAATDLTWLPFTWDDTSKLDGSGPRDEVKAAVLDDLLIVTGIASVDASYVDHSEMAHLPLTLTPFLAGGNVLSSGFPVNYMVGTTDIRAGWARLRHATGDDTHLHLSLSCNGGTPGAGANVYISGSIRLEGKP